MSAAPGRPLAILGARLVDPASGYDGPGAVLVRDGRIADVVRSNSAPLPSPDVETIDSRGAMLCPGLVDLRVMTGEPGDAAVESLETTARAAAAGGVTTIVIQPDTQPVIDDPALAAFIDIRGQAVDAVNILPAVAGTKGLAGEALADIGLSREAGAVMVANGESPIADSRVLRRLLTYAAHFGMVVAHRPSDPWLSEGAVATEGELAGRMGLPAEPVASETIGLARTLALASLTGARLLVDKITAAEPLTILEAAKAAGASVAASASINNLVFNEIDIGDYRASFRLTPPLRSEEDRQALIEALRSGLVEIVVSDHCPVAEEEKRRPFGEATPGSLGLETLLAGLIGLHLEAGVPLLRLIGAASLAPARLIGLDTGRLAPGAPADLLLCDLATPWVADPAGFASKARNSAFAGRRLQGRVSKTLHDGRVVFSR